MKNSVRFITLIIAVLLVLGLSACGGKDGGEKTAPTAATTTEQPFPDPTTYIPSEPENPEENGAVSDGVYTNKWADFSFRIPDGWKDITDEMKFETSSSKLVFASRDSVAVSGMYSNLNVILEKIPSDSQIKTTEDYAEEAKKTLADSLKAQGITAVVSDEIETVSIGEEEYRALRSDCNLVGVEYIQYSICRVVDTRAVIITISVPNDEAAADLMTFLADTHLD